MTTSARIIAGLALGLGGCASPSVLLLPNEAGSETGAVAVIKDDGSEVVVDRPLTQARLRGSTSTRTVRKIDKNSTALLAGLPPRSVSFTLYFEMGSTSVTADSRQNLDAIRREIASRSGAEAQVTGHTDTVGDDETNDRLSLRRAEEVVELLVSEGFPRDILTTAGRGERELLVPTGQEVSNPQNRRVEVIVR